MKRKRTDSTLLSSTRSISPPNNSSSKLVQYPIGSNVEIQLDDGKWHSGVVIQCQTKKYLVQVDQQQYSIDFDLIRTNSHFDQKRNAPFEYRPGQYLRNESKSPTKISSIDEQNSSSTNDSNEISTETKRKRIPRLSTSSTTNETKKSPFVWKPSTTTTSTIQTRRSSKNGQFIQISSEENSNRTRNSTEEKTNSTNSVSNSAESIPSAEVLIFRPIIRFVDSTSENADEQSTKRHSSTDDDEIPLKSSRIADESHGIDSRSSSRTSSDNVYLINGSSFECQQSKSEGKSSCFLETPPPSLPDIHLTQESESPQDKQQNNKSKRKQERPQRKSIPKQPINTLLDRILIKQDDSNKMSSDLCDPGYLSDEYGEPSISSTSTDLEEFYRRLIDPNDDFSSSSSSSNSINDDDRILHQEFLDFLSSTIDNYQRLDHYRSEYYHDETNPRIQLISNILKELFLIGSNQSMKFRQIFSNIPNEIQTHLRLCLNNVIEENHSKKKIVQRGKRFSQQQQNFSSKIRTTKNKRTSSISTELVEQQYLLSPSSPLTPSLTKVIEQTSTDELLSPNQTGVIEELTVLPKERDVYEIIHCLCQCQIDNGFMIQCESCLCWSHCECVGVTATCIPAFFKCNLCLKAEAERNSTCVLSSLFDEDLTSLFGLTSINAEKISRILFYSKQLANLREQMIELKLRSTPNLRQLQFALRCDDLMELRKYSSSSISLQSDRLKRQIEERKLKRQHLQIVAQTIDEILDDVCQSNRVSTCSTIDLKRTTNIDDQSDRTISDSMEILLNHLCDDEETKMIRSTIEIRYREMINEIDEKLEKIFIEHQKIENEMKIELGISPDDRSDDYLSYQTYESALRNALERFKS